MIDFITRPLRAMLLALTFPVSYRYAYAVLKIEDRRDAGTLTKQELAQAVIELIKQDFND